MDNLELIKKIKKPAMEVMKENEILASFTIACAMNRLSKFSERDSLTLINANNVMGKTFIQSSYNNDFVSLDGKASRGKRYKVYYTIKECIIDWLMGFKSSLIQGVWDISKICQKLSNKDFNLTALKPFIDAYQLDKIDDSVFEELYPSGQTIIEVPVSESFAYKYQQLSGYNGILPEPQSTLKEVSFKKKEEEQRALTYTAGEKATASGANLYKSYTDRVPYRAYSGNVWLYDGKLINGRYAVVLKKDSIGKEKGFIDGYIKKSELK